ncbi:MAG: putative transporter substrate-binding protein [Ilumatobacteraceae bacterium]|nr:putative transporter substrate-binding protein [Ilumatobacteraceae bacterium]
MITFTPRPGRTSRAVRTALLIGVSLAAVTACSSDSKSTTTTAAASTTAGPATSASSAPATTDSTTATTGSIATDGSTATTGSTTGSAADTTPTTSGVPYSSGTLTLPAKPVAIVSLSPTATEDLFALGAGSQLVAVDDQSNYPAAVSELPATLSGYTPNVEAIAAFKPDLVVISDDTSGVAEQLTALKIPVWTGPAAVTLDDVYTQIGQLGALTGHGGEATKLVGQMQTDIAKALDGLPDTEVPLTYYHELDNTFFSITSNTFLGQIYSLAGLVNIADQAESGSDYPQLNSEFIITADPQLIFLADTKCCGESPQTVAARDGWPAISAVKNNSVIAMDDDIASRWGPRIVDYVKAVVAAVDTAASVPAG